MSQKTEMIDLAREWVRTDPSAAADDASRLGLERAANFNLALLWQAVQDGDDRWMALLPRWGADSHRAMVDALAELVDDDG